MLTNYLQIPCQKIISGGQTGVDRGALDASLKNNFSCGGWCPKGRLAEDGIIHKKYPLNEMIDTTYSSRTKQNVIDSDGTLIIFPGTLSGGTLLTRQIANELSKPLYLYKKESNYKFLINWLVENDIKVLNVAGPRESEWKKGYKITFKTVSNIINEVKNRTPNSGLNH